MHNTIQSGLIHTDFDMVGNLSPPHKGSDGRELARNSQQMAIFPFYFVKKCQFHPLYSDMF